MLIKHKNNKGKDEYTDLKKRAKDMNLQFPKEEMHMYNMHTKNI